MEPSDLSFADEFNVPQEYVVLVFDVRRAAASFPFPIRRLLDVCRSRPGRLLERVFRVCGLNSLANLPKIFSSHLHGLSKVAVVGFCA